MQYWKTYVLVIALMVSAVFSPATLVHAEERATLLVYKDSETRRLLILPKTPGDSFVSNSLQRTWDTSFANTWCKSLMLTYWSNSKHPGYKYPQFLNQNQGGIGFKCRKEGDHPAFISVDTMKNSQFGETFAFSVGKQIDLINYSGIRYYRGASVTALSYEMPARNKVAYGAAPIWHRGVSVDLSRLLSVRLPRNFKGTVGWEELTLPKDNIRVRAWNAEIRLDF